jgi:hypothetical protein
MGLDRFANFILKSINNEGIEEVNIYNNIYKIVTNHIIFDINFLIYQEILEIENEINDIIKINLTEDNESNKILEQILLQDHWKNIPYNNYKDIMTYINKNTNLELVIYQKIVKTIIDYIDNLHNIEFVNTISIFFDGIPSFSKVIEQRRRRIKNYIESNEKKKLFKTYFDQLLPTKKKLSDNLNKPYNLVTDNLYFDYFKWIDNRFNIDKILGPLGPSSNFIKNLEIFINKKIQEYYPKIKIIIHSAQENGESDLKIFKYISINNDNIDYCIHTTDSDIIHQMLTQQTYYKIINKNINISVIKYLKNYNSIGYVQILEGNLIIKNILDLYNSITNLSYIKISIVWDICLIFFLFGNDHLPSSLEIGPELGLTFFLKKHFESLNNNNIVLLKDNNVTIDLHNLLLYLSKINETKQNNITRIILQRFFKINSSLLNLLVDKLDLDFDSILIFLKKFIIHKSVNMDINIYNNLNDDDLRKKLRKNINIDEYKTYEIFNFDSIKLNILIESMSIIDNNLDYYEEEYYGLVIFTKPINITTDPYQDIYNFIIESTLIKLNKHHTIFYDHINIDNHLKLLKELEIPNLQANLENDYLKKLYHLTTMQFGSMIDYHTDNLTYYKYYHVPSVSNIISFISQTLSKNQIKIWFDEIKLDNINTNDYLNDTNHHLLITPFIGLYNLQEHKNIIKKLDNINNLWLNDINTFKYRDICIIDFFKKWNEL